MGNIFFRQCFLPVNNQNIYKKTFCVVSNKAFENNKILTSSRTLFVGGLYQGKAAFLVYDECKF